MSILGLLIAMSAKRKNVKDSNFMFMTDSVNRKKREKEEKKCLIFSLNINIHDGNTSNKSLEVVNHP